LYKVFLNMDAYRRYLTMTRDSFGCHNCEMRSYIVVRGQNAVKRPILHKTAHPIAQNYVVQNIHSAEAEKLSLIIIISKPTRLR
jgi:hypothetical protein